MPARGSRPDDLVEVAVIFTGSPARWVDPDAQIKV